MDSDDEDDREESQEGGGDNAEEERPNEDQEEAGDEGEQEIVDVETLDKVQSFGRMMMFAPSVRSKLRGGSLSPVEAAATCRALARVKFFDRELLDDLYRALQKLLSEGKLGAQHTTDAVRCMALLNAYDADTFTSIARCYLAKTAELDAATRAEWGEAFKTFGHKLEPMFLQLLEVPPVTVMHPSYKKVRCFHFSRGSCAVGVACTFSHDPRAPLSLAEGTKEDWWRNKGSIMMTQNQKYMGDGSYGLGPLGVKPM